MRKCPGISERGAKVFTTECRIGRSACRCGSARRRLRRQAQLKFRQKNLQFGGRLSIAQQDQPSVVACGDVDIDHLNGFSIIAVGESPGA